MSANSLSTAKASKRFRRRKPDSRDAINAARREPFAETSGLDVARTTGDGPLTEAHKRAILERLASGRPLASLLRDRPDIPGTIAIARARRADAAWDADYEMAQALGREALIEEGIDFARTVRADKELSRQGNSYAAVCLQSAAALAPKRFGQLVKLAGADGEKLSVSVVSYQVPAQALHAVTVPAIEHVAEKPDKSDA